MWVPGAFLLPSIVHNAGLRKFSKNRNCRPFVDALLILRCRLSEQVEASSVTASPQEAMLFVIALILQPFLFVT